MAAYPTRTISNTGEPLTGPGGVVLTSTTITFTLVDSRGIPVTAIDSLTDERVVGSASVVTDAGGLFSISLWPTDRGNIATRYLVEIDYPGVESFLAVLPYGDGSTLSFTLFQTYLQPFTAEDISAFIRHVNNTANVHPTFTSALPGFAPAAGAAAATDVLRADGTWGASVTAGDGHVVRDEGVDLTQRYYLNFVGSGVTVSDSSPDTTTVTIPGGHTIQEEGTGLTKRGALNFIGSYVTAADDSGNNATTVTLGTVPVASGGTGSTSAADARTALGLALGTDVQAFSALLAAIAGLTPADDTIIVGNGITWVAETGATARTSLGLGALAVFNTINNAEWSGTDLAVINGGTGASDAATARTNLGLVIGTDVQAFDADTLKADTTAALSAGFTYTLLDHGNSGTTTLNLAFAGGLQQKVTVTGSFTLTAPTTGNGYIELLLVMDATGGYTVTLSGFETTISGTISNTALQKNLLRMTRIDGNDAVEIVQLD